MVSGQWLAAEIRRTATNGEAGKGAGECRKGDVHASERVGKRAKERAATDEWACGWASAPTNAGV